MRKYLLLLTLPLVGQITIKEGEKLEFPSSVVATVENRHIIHTGEGKLNFRVVRGDGPPPGSCGINEDSAMIVLAHNGAFICLPDRYNSNGFRWMRINGTYTTWK